MEKKLKKGKIVEPGWSRRMEQDLLDSENRYRLLAENITDVVSILDMNLRFIYVSPSVTSVLGYTVEESLAKTLAEIMLPSSFDHHREIIEKDMADIKRGTRSPKEFRVMDVELLRKDGRVVWGELRASIFIGDNGQPMGILGITRDITKRKRAEEVLRETNEYLENLINYANAPIIIWDPQLRITRFNCAFELLTGRSADDVIGKSIEILFPANLAQSSMELIRKAMKGERWETVEINILHLDGSVRAVIWNSATLFDSDGKTPVATIAQGQDITARKQADQDLKESESRFRAIIEGSTDGIIFCEMATRKIIFANEAIAQLSGYSREEIAAMNVQDLHRKDDWDSVRREFERHMSGEISFSANIPVVRKDGDILFVEITSAIISIKDKRYFAAFFRNITARKRAEEALERTLKLEQEVVLLQRSLLAPGTLNDKLKIITDGIVRILGADFCRIWLIRSGDLCGHGCIHDEVREGPHVCRFRDKCLHLMASSGRYTHIDGKGHARVPFGCYKLGLIASGEEHKFLTNDVVNDPRVHNHEWARELGLVSFAGYQLRIPGGETIGVLALFAKHALLPADDAILESISISSAFVAQEAVAEEALKESESKFRTIIEGSNDGIIFCNEATMTIIFANAAMSRLLGYSRKELAGMTIQDLHPKDDWDSERREFERHISGEISSSANIPVVRKDGDILFADISSARISVKGKRYFTGFFRNITERKKTEEKLSHFQKAVDSASDAIGMSTPDGRHYYQNEAFTKLFGLSVIEVNGASGPPATVYADGKVGRMVFDAIMRGDFWTGEVKMLDKDRNEKDILQRAYSIKDKEGKVIGLVGMHTDITERKRAEEALKESENKYRGLFESSRDAIMTIEPPSWKFTSGNPATMEMFRVRNSEEFSKQGPGDLSPERQPDGRPSAEKAREMIEAAIRDGSSHFEWTHKRFDGEEFPSTVLLTRMEQAGKIIIQATVRDITVRKEMEKRLMMAERLAAVGTFVAGAGHELNNPLACVIGFSQLALGKLERGKFDREELRGALEKVASNADRCRAILGSLLSCGRGYSLQLASMDLHEVIDEAIDLSERQLSFEHIELNKEYSLDIPHVFGNRDALSKVFVNVALNACQAMNDRGVLKIITEREGNWVRVIFKDSGVGIKKEDLHKVFDPFFSTKEVGKGAGLGLSVCVGIVKSHDGDITVQSDGEGKGTTVTIMLPIEKRGGYEKE